MRNKQQPSSPSRIPALGARFAVAAIASGVLALAVFPALAAAATQTLTIEKLGTGTGTVTSSPAGIDCGSECAAGFTEGASVALTGTPGANTAAVAWAGCTKVNLENECLVTMSAAKTVKATFNLIKRQLTVTKNGTGTGTVTSAPTGIECGVICSAGFTQGTVVTLTAVSGVNTEAVSWSGCGSLSEGKCTVTMSAVKAVTATFNLEKHQLTVTRNGSGTGTVTSSPTGIECGATCSASLSHGTAVTLIGSPGLHSEAAQWSGCDTVNGKGECEVTMSAAKAVTATFKLEPAYVLYTVSVKKGGTGTGTVTSAPAGIECGATCSTEVLAKTKVTLTATPAPGSVFAHWSGGGCVKAAPCERTITSTRTVKAVFTAVGVRTLSIALAGTGAGTVKNKAAGIQCSASCAPEVAAGKKITLSAKAAAGSSFSGWSGACSGTKACRVQMSEAHSVTATFAKVPTLQPTGAATVANRAKVKGGKAFVGIRCNGPSSCRGSLKLLAKLKSKGKSVAIGSATFSLAPGSSATLKVKLSGAAKQLLKSAGQLRARVRGTGVSPHVVRLKG
jgi:hypothetical protein